MENFENTMDIPVVDSGIIKNQELRSLVEYKLEKSDFRADDLIEIKDIILDGLKIDGSTNIVYFQELELFPNLEQIELKNLNISEENIARLKRIPNIKFYKCEIEDFKPLNSQESISISGCQIGGMEEIAKIIPLESIELVNVKIEDFNFLRSLENLKVLKIKNIERFYIK
jgi:hypothetical protein